MTLAVRVDVTNPGQFFACCGLFELAARIDPDAVACFDRDRFVVTGAPSLAEVIEALVRAPLHVVDPDDTTASPLHLGVPFEMRLDWWKDESAGGRDLKVWAGTMQSTRILAAMIAALRGDEYRTEQTLDVGRVVFDPADPLKKVEPFYFDARRAPNAHSRDVGFSPNDLDLTTTAFPSVEALCFVGLQRFRPRAAAGTRRLYRYRPWTRPLPPPIAAVAACGVVATRAAGELEFEVWFRTGQKKHKAFRAATVTTEGE